MKIVIFNTENAVFKFTQMEVETHLIGNKTDYSPDEVSQLLELISIDRDETILNPDDHSYFGYIALDLIGSEIGR